MISQSERGFSLIEMIITIIILTLAVGTIVSAFSEVVRMSVMPEVINTGTGLAEQEIERVTGLRFSSVTNEGPAGFPGSFSNYSYQISASPVPVSLAVDPGMARYKQVQVTVTHATAGSVSLSTVAANN